MRLSNWFTDHLPVRRGALDRDIYHEVRAQTAPMKLHLSAIERHLHHIETVLAELKGTQ